MAKENNLADLLKEIADAIREKNGTTELINPQEFSARIRAIAGLPGIEREPINTLEAFFVDIADSIRDAEGTTDLINPQDFAERVRTLTKGAGDTDTPLYFEAISDISVSFSNPYQYSADNQTWTDAAPNTTISANIGKKVYFRASGLTATSTAGIGTFAISGNCNVGGNIMSMLYGGDFADKTTINQSYAFYNIFRNQTGIRNAKDLKLPATTLTQYCYYAMFYGCVDLVTAPELPATNLAQYCYANMFRSTKIDSAPKLPATAMEINCYRYMFASCTSLVNAPELPASSLADYCYYSMFYDCTSLVNAPALPATSLYIYCYQYMFYGCTGLVNAPELPAVSATTHCYYGMFYGCTSLVNAPELPATSLAPNCYQRMFYGCTSLVNPPALPAQTFNATYTYAEMFYGCTSLVNAPELPATSLVPNCYEKMFNNCTSLQYIKALFLSAPTSTYTFNWVEGVPTGGTFVKNKEATWANSFGVSAIPSGWNVITE